MQTLDCCPVCSAVTSERVYAAPTTRGQDKKLWSVFECSACSHQFMNPQPSWEDLKPYYTAAYDPYNPDHGRLVDDSEALADARQSGRLRHIDLPVDKKILDVGCGAGYFLRLAKKLGAIEQGVEPSEYATSIAKTQGLNVFCGTLEEFAVHTDEKFNVITSNHVIEHVPNPVETLATMKSLLAPEGFIWISVPNAAYPISKSLNGLWHSADLPYHLMHFSPKSMALAGHKAGLKTRKQVTESIPRIVEASLGQYLRYRWMLPRKITHATGILKPIANWYARRADAKTNGEAIITEFIA